MPLVPLSGIDLELPGDAEVLTGSITSKMDVITITVEHRHLLGVVIDEESYGRHSELLRSEVWRESCAITVLNIISKRSDALVPLTRQGLLAGHT